MITPYGKTYVLWPGANYENGRVKQQGDKSGQCGLTVDKAKDTDNGKWQCNLSFQGQGGNAIAETRDVSVTVAGMILQLCSFDSDVILLAKIII